MQETYLVLCSLLAVAQVVKQNNTKNTVIKLHRVWI